MWATNRLVLALLLVASVVSAQDYNVAPARPRTAGGGATDWTAVSGVYCWIMQTTNDETDTENNLCLGSTDLTHQGSGTTWNGTAPAGTGNSRLAASLTNGSDFVMNDSAYNSGTDPTTYTVMMWVFNNGGGSDTLFHKGTNAKLSIGLSGGGYHIQADTSASDITTTGAITNGSTAHVAMTVSGTTTRVYLNGVEDCGGTCPSNGSGHPNNTEHWTFGGTHSGTELLEGRLHEIMLYPGTVLTQAEICGIYKNGVKADATSATRTSTYGSC